MWLCVCEKKTKEKSKKKCNIPSIAIWIERSSGEKLSKYVYQFWEPSSSIQQQQQHAIISSALQLICCVTTLHLSTQILSHTHTLTCTANDRAHFLWIHDVRLLERAISKCSFVADCTGNLYDHLLCYASIQQQKSHHHYQHWHCYCCCCCQQQINA